MKCRGTSTTPSQKGGAKIVIRFDYNRGVSAHNGDFSCLEPRGGMVTVSGALLLRDLPKAGATE
jgi:hypothetical protein